MADEREHRPSEWRRLVRGLRHVPLTAFALLIAACTPPAYVKVTFDDLQGALTDTSDIARPNLQATIGTGGFRPAEIQRPSVSTCGGFYSNDNELAFDPQFPVDLAVFRFAELGGQNRLTVNGEPHDVRDIVNLQGLSGMGYTITVQAEQVGANWYGSVTLEGSIDVVSIRGQELLIDDLVFRTETGAVPHRILLDGRTRSNTSPRPSTYEFRDLLLANGYDVDIHTNGPLGAGALDGYDVYISNLLNHDSEDPTHGYEAGEPDRLQDFIASGKSAFLIAEFGPNLHEPVYSFFLGPLGIQHDNNLVVDPTDSALEPFWVFYERGRNFECHPIVRQVDKIQLKASATVAGSPSAAVIYTDSDSTPSGKPVLLATKVGSGRLAVVGDSSWLEPNDFEMYDHKALALGIVDWLALRQ